MHFVDTIELYSIEYSSNAGEFVSNIPGTFTFQYREDGLRGHARVPVAIPMLHPGGVAGLG